MFELEQSNQNLLQIFRTATQLYETNTKIYIVHIRPYLRYQLIHARNKKSNLKISVNPVEFERIGGRREREKINPKICPTTRVLYTALRRGDETAALK